MARDLSKLSTTPASNDATGGFKTGMRPSSVKNAGWADESILAQLFNALPVGGGTAAAQTLTNPVPLTALTDGLTVFMLPGAANGSGATFSPDGLTAEPIFANGAAVVGGEMQQTVPALLKYRLAVTAWELINPQPPGKNFFVDPCCRVQQGVNNLALSTSYQYGLVDLVQCKATGTLVTAGTIGSASIASATGFGCSITGATITGAGKTFFRRWIESRDTAALNGQTVLFSVLVKHSVGSNINAFLTLNKFQSVDSPGTPTLLATGSTVSIATGAATLITLTYTFGSADGSNGIELIVEMDCGAVTNQAFTATDWQCCINTLAQRCVVPRFEDDLIATMRYFEKSYEYGTKVGTATTNNCASFRAASGGVGAGVGYGIAVRYRAEKLASPTITLYSTNTGSSGLLFDATTAADKSTGTTSTGSGGFEITNSAGATTVAADLCRFQWAADTRL